MATSTQADEIDGESLDEIDLRELATSDEFELIFAKAYRDGPTLKHRESLWRELDRLGLTPTDEQHLRDLLMQGAGFMAARVEEYHRERDRIETNIAALNRLVEERREERDHLDQRYEELRTFTGQIFEAHEDARAAEHGDDYHEGSDHDGNE